MTLRVAADRDRRWTDRFPDNGMWHHLHGSHRLGVAARFGVWAVLRLAGLPARLSYTPASPELWLCRVFTGDAGVER